MVPLKQYKAPNTICYRFFQVSTTSSTNGVSHGFNPSFFAEPPPLAAQAHNCLSGSLLSPTSSQQHSIFRSDAPSQLC